MGMLNVIFLLSSSWLSQSYTNLNGKSGVPQWEAWLRLLLSLLLNLSLSIFPSYCSQKDFSKEKYDSIILQLKYLVAWLIKTIKTLNRM